MNPILKMLGEIEFVKLFISLMIAKCFVIEPNIFDAIILGALILALCHGRVEDRLDKTRSSLEDRLKKAEEALENINKDLSRFNEISQKMEKQSQDVQKILTGEAFKNVFNPRRKML